MIVQPAIDKTKLQQFMGTDDRPHDRRGPLLQHLAGRRAGPLPGLAGSGPLTADSLADETGCHPRLVREWLDGQAAGGLVAYDRRRGHLRARPRGRDGPRR